MANKELDCIIDWCRTKMKNEKKNLYGCSGKRLEGYEKAMLAVMSYLHGLKEDVWQ
jgi:hypothetical protein